MTNDPDPAATPIAFSFAPKPRRKVTYRTYRLCKHKAPCGGTCILNSNSPHSYHSCKQPDCICHSRERFRFGGKR